MVFKFFGFLFSVSGLYLFIGDFFRLLKNHNVKKKDLIYINFLIYYFEYKIFSQKHFSTTKNNKTFQIAVMPQEVYEKIILSIEITDVNDNSPVFRSNEVRLEIPEALGVGEEFEVSELIAKDADIEDFATVSYSIVPPGTFDIAVKNGRTFLKVKITVLN